MKLYKIIALMLCCIFTVGNIYAQIYEITPDVSNCEKGALTLAEKNRVIKMINKIRKHHDLGEIVWSDANEKYAQSAALSMLATGIMSHGATSGKCCNADSDTGRASCNLSMHSATGGASFPSEDHIYGWLRDNYSQTQPYSVGHRRLIINPFLSATCLGKAEGVHPTNTGWYLGVATLWGINSNVMQPSTCKNDYVAYPYKNYPIDWVDPSFYLSFSPIADPTWWWGGNNKVKFDNAKIKMTADGKSVEVTDLKWDYDAWGCFINNLSWKVVGGLKNEVRYDVTISNVIVNGSTREYTYWFKLTNEDNDDEPSVSAPTLVYPTPALKDLDLTDPVTFKWNRVEGIYRYELQLSLSNDFNYIYDNYETNDTAISVSNLVGGRTFYWRVAGFYNPSEDPVYSEIWSFSTKEEVVDPPTPVYPSENASNVYLREVYKWNSILSALYYRIQISTTEKFTTGTVAVDVNEIADTVYYLAANEVLEANTQYFWRVSATLPNGSVTNWCNPVKFTTGEEYSTINEPSQLASSVIYPNPTNSYFAVLLNLSAPANNLTISIADMSGNIIMTNNCGYAANGRATYSFNTSNLSSGTYNVILNIDGKTKVEKLVIER